jgi:hypothetical protein
VPACLKEFIYKKCKIFKIVNKQIALPLASTVIVVAVTEKGKSV